MGGRERSDMTAKSALKAALLADVTIASIAGVRVLDSEDVSAEGLKLEHMLSGSNPLIQPTVYLRWSSDNVLGIRSMMAHEAFVETWCYQHKGYVLTAQLRQAIRERLDQQMLSDADGKYWFVWAGDVLEQVDPTLGDARVERSRYQVHFREVG
jgi:hypothetical protein